MTNTWSNETVIDFINEVHLHPELWDVKSGHYKDRNVKKDGWAEVAEKFGIGSDDAYKKFRSLRTYAQTETKKNKSGSSGGKSVKWFAFDSISFVLNQNIANPGLESDSAAPDNLTANTGLENEKNTTPNVEYADTDIRAGPEEVVDSATTDSLETITTSSKPRGKRSKTTDPLLEKAENIIRDAGGKKRNEYASFGEHIANKLSKYDDYTRTQAEFKIMQILFECDMSMYRTRPTSSRSQYSDLSTPPPPSPQNSSRDGASTSQSQYYDITALPLQNNVQDQSQVPQLPINSYEELVTYTLQYESQK
ncbi:alcohol dehydrogenase transcription factor myb/SANT-like domain-containing protein [Phthorimaea operculella]|nr:alcohol dehydrogenase transcription factor myb/SANT-like domain-containing protein [Phthorimaea operculella]